MGSKKLELISCPHCGGDKFYFDSNGYGYGTDYEKKPDVYWVVCDTCCATGGPGSTKKEAAENWNRRVKN
jgi:Lar family restriction alleviation protein